MFVDFQIHKLGQLLLEVDVEDAGGTGAVFGHNDLGDVGELGVRVVHVIPIDEQHHVRARA